MFKIISKWIEKVKIKKTPQKSQIEYVTLTPDDKIANVKLRITLELLVTLLLQEKAL